MARRSTRTDNLNHRQLLAAERSRLRLSPHGALRVAVGAPAGYHVGMSSLAFQWVLELASQVPDVGLERFFSGSLRPGATLDSGTPLGDLDVLAWSCSFEPDAVELLRTLDAAGIPRRRVDRGPRHPLLVVGGPLASINPLPLAPAVDVFCLGAAELLWPPLLELVRTCASRNRLLQELAQRDGYLVPELHTDSRGRPLSRLRRREKRDSEMSRAELIPASHTITPHTEYAERVLIELSRGCPERCRYCWASHNAGRLRPYPTAGILQRLDEAAALTRRVGLMATAAGDHPDLELILEHALRRGMDLSMSSLRIPSLRSSVLEPLVASGARSLTIAPETGSDQLRARLGKAVSNAQILDGVAAACRSGIRSLKTYFILGLPGETDDDVLAIAGLVRAARQIMVRGSREAGRVGRVTAAINLLAPKPYTPYHREAVLGRSEWRRRLALLERRLSGVGNVSLQRASWRETVWQSYLARADARAFDHLEGVASGLGLGRLMADQRAEIEGVTTSRREGDPWWHFIASAPQPA